MFKYMRLLVLLVCDALLVAAAVYLSYLLRFDFAIKSPFIETLPYVVAIYIGLLIFSFYIYKIYKRIWRYASVGDLLAIMQGALLGSVAFYLIHHYTNHPWYSELVVPRSIYPLTTMISFLFVGGSRFLWRLTRHSFITIKPHHRRVLIVGAGEAGIMVLRELRQVQSEQYPVAFIDDDVQKQNYEIMGIPVVGKRSDIQYVVKKFKIDDIIVALPSASRADVSDIINHCKSTGCQMKILPKVNDLINGKITINMIRDVSVEDLLGREPVKVSLEEIAGYLKERVVLVTGAGGSIGSEISRQVAAISPETLIVLDHGENSIYDIDMELRKVYPNLRLVAIIADIKDKKRLDQVFQKYRPQVVFHAAAHKHVPLMECNPLEAINNNVFGTKNLAECAHTYGVKRFVLISTDKAVNPSSVMGATKRVAEMIVQDLGSRSETIFAAVRFGNVLGSRGSVVPLFKKQIEYGGPVTVTHPEMVRYFMTIPEAVQLVIQAGAIANGGETFILDMGKPVKIADLAHDLIRLSGLEPNKDIQVIYTGIRPGEKLFEELLSAEEGAAATKHDRIYIGKQLDVSREQLSSVIEKLQQELYSNDSVQQILKSVIPTFQLDMYAQEVDQNQTAALLNAALEVVATVEKKQG